MRIVLASLLTLLALGVSNGRAAAQQACGEVTVTRNGATYRVLFAKNRAVQQYVLVRGTENTENDHDVLVELQSKYGPEGVNAPPARVISYKAGPNGMMIPLKQVDSCGRVTELQ